MNFSSWLTLAFIVLKLTGFIDWSWWLVISPLPLGELLGTILIKLGKLDTQKTIKSFKRK